MLLFSLKSISAEKLPGYYVGVRGDTTFCTFDIPIRDAEIDYKLISESVTTFNEKGKKQRIKAGQVRSFAVKLGSLEEKFVSIKLYDKYVFLKHIVKGWANLYTHHFSSDDNNTTYEQYVLTFPFKEAVVVRPKRFRKQLIKYTQNDSFFTAKFAGDTKYEDLPGVITRYNELKSTNN